LITLEGKEYLVNKLPYSFRKNRSKEYFRINKMDTEPYLKITPTAPYTIKIMD